MAILESMQGMDRFSIAIPIAPISTHISSVYWKRMDMQQGAG